MGLTSFFQKKLYETLGYRIVALVCSPVYSPYELLRNLGAIGTIQNAGILMTNFAEALIPRYFVRGTFNSDAIKLIVTMSRQNKQRLEKIGVKPDKLVCVPPGVAPSFLERPSLKDVGREKAEICDGIDDCFLATYFGPPLNVRGIDTLLLAVELAFEKSPPSSRLRVLILSRGRGEEYHAHKERLLRLVSKLGLNRVVKLKHGFLSKEEVKIHLAASDLVVLPFKHVISDVPISIMEGMALGTPVLSTDLDGIPELLGDRRGFVIKPGDFRRLAELIAHYSQNTEELKKRGERARKYMLSHPVWKDSASTILSLLKRSMGNEVT
jgi:glycosyltransferase involved in cell wall biosynthesis